MYRLYIYIYIYIFFFLDYECRQIKNRILNAYNKALGYKPAVAETLKAHGNIQTPTEVRENGRKLIKEVKEKIRTEQKNTLNKEMEVREYWTKVGRLHREGRIGNIGRYVRKNPGK